MWLLSTPKRWHNQQNRGNTQDLDRTFIFFESKVQEGKTWRATTARRSLESKGRHERWQEAWLFLSCGQITQRWDTQKFPSGKRMQWISWQNFQLSLPTRLTFRTLRLITTGLATRTPSRWKVATQMFKQALWPSEKTSRKQQRCCTVFEKNKAKWIRSSHRRKEQGKEMS